MNKDKKTFTEWLKFIQSRNMVEVSTVNFVECKICQDKYDPKYLQSGICNKCFISILG